ncbi:MAG: hypothetical protein RLZZ361_128 [Cyanobacteriota bacterium]|jgi:hypothetical protein
MSNKLKQCDICGCITSSSLRNGVCNECMAKDDELYTLAKNSMKFGEKMLPEELSNKTGIDCKHILRWVRHGRFGS